MSKYKLTYFNLNALAEPIRWLFKVASVEIEDERFERDAWENLKESGRCPGRQVPLLEIDGIVYTQTNAILRYLGRKFGLVADDGEDGVLNLRIDQIVDIISEGRAVFHSYFWHSYIEPNPQEREEVKKNLANNVLPLVLKQINDIVSVTDGEFITGLKLTWGDLVLANWLLIWQDQINPNLLKDFPVLSKQKQAVLSTSQIKEWLEIRPKVPF